jgi:YVTN family beta-propeller protein
MSQQIDDLPLQWGRGGDMQKARVASWIAVLGLLALGLPALLLFRESARPDPIREEASQVQAPNAAPTVLPAYGYVTNIGEDTVSVIDLGSQTEVDRIPVGEGPYEIALSLDERWALVTNSYTNTVSFIDTELRQEVAQVKVGILPRGLAIGPNGRAFVANSGEATMSVIDINSRTVITKVAGFPSNVWDVTIAPNGNYAYLTNEGGSGDIYQVDASTWQVSELISGVPGCGAGLAMSPDGAFLYAADPCRKALRVVNIAARTYTVQPLTMGQGAWDVAVTSSGDLLPGLAGTAYRSLGRPA